MLVLKSVLFAAMTLGVSLSLVAGLEQDLMEAVQSGDLAKVQQLVAAGADVNILDSLGSSPVAIAAAKGHMAIVQHLLLHHANLRAVGNEDIVSIAIALGNRQIALLLAEKGAYLKQPSYKCRWSGPLCQAILKKDQELLVLLLSLGCDPNEHENILRSETPLHVAAWSGDLPATRRLLRAGADPNSLDKYGMRPYQTARKAGKEEVASFLEKRALRAIAKRGQV